MTNRAPRPWLALSCAIGFAACASDAPGAEAAEAAQLVAVSATALARHGEAMAVHDEVMPERGRLVRLQRALADRPGDTAALRRLTAADDAMMDWMYAEIPLARLADSLNEAALLTFLDERTRQIGDVADSMRASMAAADRILAE